MGAKNSLGLNHYFGRRIRKLHRTREGWLGLQLDLPFSSDLYLDVLLIISFALILLYLESLVRTINIIWSRILYLSSAH